MTTPFKQEAFPSNPASPSGPPAGYTQPTSAPPTTGEPPKTSAELSAIRGQFWELLLQKVVEALVGVFLPGNGSAATQLAQWALNLPNQILQFIRDIAGIDLTSWNNFLASLNDGKGIDIPFLADLIETIAARIDTIIDTIVQALTGAATIGNTLADLARALLEVPARNIQGILGSLNLGDDAQAILDFFIGGFVNQQGSGASLADAFNIAREIGSGSFLGKLAAEILGIRNNKPADGGLLPSERSNFDLSAVTTWHAATQSASLIGLDYIEQDMPLGVVSWIGYGTSGLTALYVNIWKVDLNSGDFTLVHHSPNIVGLLTATADPGEYVSYELDEPFNIFAKEIYAYEIVPVGGTHNVRGRTSNTPYRPSTAIVAHAATRNNTTSPNDPPETIAKASVTRSLNVPWVGIAVDTGSGEGHHDDDLRYIGGDVSFPIPNWANFIDVIGVGGGGGGRAGLTFGLYGEAGGPGRWNATTWARGTHFTGTSTSITIDVGAAGIGGPGVGDRGGNTVVSIPGYSMTAIGGEPGDAVRPVTSGKPVGRGPGTFNYNGIAAVGGVNQNSYGGQGVAPGGAGNGGNYVSFQPGGNGAPGGAWIRFRQDPLPGEEVVGGDGDTTPPAIDDLDVAVETTINTITITPSGAVDA
ncbi:minor tail protein [Mycobacterium phage Constella]|nr:minor tail protein [Mycobacterium phage Constella]QBI98673.1 minor tail protein [Mycobacterium phage Bobby]